MKKILLTSICLLALTACSQGQAEKGKASTTSSQSTSQVKKEKEENVRTKTFSTELNDHHQNKIQIGYKKDEIVSFTFLSFEPISSDLQDMDLSELKEIYQEELEHSDIYKSLNGKPGLSFRIQISKDKQSYAKVLQADFSKIKKDEFASIYGDQGEEETAEFKKYLNGKPQDLFTYFKDQGLKEEKYKELPEFHHHTGESSESFFLFVQD